MDCHAAIKLALDTADAVSMAYLADMDDQDLLRRPHPGCNHINWQIGHLILAENNVNNLAVPGSMPALPVGFAEKYSKHTIASDNAADFLTKSELMRVYQEQRSATLVALSDLSDEGLSRPSGVEHTPTVGGVFLLQGCHWLMHAGQWVAVRRQCGKPQLF
jgi:hypothetical protein